MSASNKISTHPSSILVIGAGVLGLSTATLLQTQHPSTPITLVASEFPVRSPMLSSSTAQSEKASPSYASMWAGAHYRPIPYIPSVHPTFASLPPEKQAFHRQLAKEQNWAIRTAERMRSLVNSAASEKCGVQIVQGEEYLESPPPENLLLQSGDVYASRQGDGFRVWGKGDLAGLNEQGEGKDMGQVKWACSYATYVVNVHMYCAYLLQRFVERGGRTLQRRLGSIDEAISTRDHPSPAIIVNCSGVGVDTDPNKNLIRGQTVLVRNEFPKTITRQCEDGTWSFLIPRPCGGGTVVGGTKQVGDEDGLPRAEERNRLLENAVSYFPGFVGRVQDFEIVCDNVGFRPARKGGVRIEVEDRVRKGGETAKVVHAYGAGGRGYEISWGVAEEVCGIVNKVLGQESHTGASRRRKHRL